MSPLTRQLRAVFVYGRLKAFSRERIRKILVNDGGSVVRSPARADAVVVAHAAARRCIAGDALALPFALPQLAALMSEGAFVALMEARPGAAISGPYRLDDVARLAHLPEPACRALALFDVIGPSAETFTYRDLATAKQAARLLREGLDLAAIVTAGLVLGRRGLRMAQTRLVAAPWGEIVQSVGERIVQLDGQFLLVLDNEVASADRLFDEASERERQGDFDGAERIYEHAGRLDRTDPVIPFNRGNALVAMARRTEAMIAFRQALDRDPVFAEAAFNLAHLLEEDRRTEEAERFYRQALEIHAGYAAAAYNLARILTDRRAFVEAVPLWDRYLKAAPDDPDSERGRRLMLLCRMEAARQSI